MVPLFLAHYNYYFVIVNIITVIFYIVFDIILL